MRMAAYSRDFWRGDRWRTWRCGLCHQCLYLQKQTSRRTQVCAEPFGWDNGYWHLVHDFCDDKRVDFSIVETISMPSFLSDTPRVLIPSISTVWTLPDVHGQAVCSVPALLPVSSVYTVDIPIALPSLLLSL